MTVFPFFYDLKICGKGQKKYVFWFSICFSMCTFLLTLKWLDMNIDITDDKTCLRKNECIPLVELISDITISRTTSCSCFSILSFQCKGLLIMVWGLFIPFLWIIELSAVLWFTIWSCYVFLSSRLLLQKWHWCELKSGCLIFQQQMVRQYTGSENLAIISDNIRNMVVFTRKIRRFLLLDM